MQKTNQTTLPQTRDPFQSLFQRLFGDTLPELYGASETNSLPRANISETETSYELAFELPGVEEKDIQVHMQNQTLMVTAERKDQRETEGKRWHRVEHRYGQFSRTISLPHDATNKGIEAVYRKGVLTVTVPKAPESRPAKIAVRSD
ncbi:MAG TPA: Hsp20/alpha crystallin family protein [Planctomycetota bacterium]|nr:Hsp20/alpha crystallin family protein [Planctomycetota bacterium]